MGTEAVTNVTSPGIALDPSKRPEADRQQIKRLAQEFEAMLMTQMLREMRKSMLDDKDGKEDGFGSDAMTDTADVELGQALSRAGGVGLTDAMLNAFERQIKGMTQSAGEVGTTGAPGPTGELGPTGALGPTGDSGGPGTLNAQRSFLLDQITTAAPVSSKFGWRQDPLTGAAAFHHGVDIAVAYGQDVKAAADGVVSFSGVQNGYGQTVVIDHDGGRQTRYAHLSQEFVRAGDVVAEGQVLGKSGNSGRTTGPHLHFEMLVNGRPVDPAIADE